MILPVCRRRANAILKKATILQPYLRCYNLLIKNAFIAFRYQQAKVTKVS
jgi:hypothetical protein